MLRPFKSLQHTEVTSSHLILVLLFYFILKVILLFHQYLLNIKFCGLCWLFIFLIKCCIYVSSKIDLKKNPLKSDWRQKIYITEIKCELAKFCGPSARPGLCCEPWGHLLVSLKFKRRPLLTAYVPHNHRLVVTPGEQQTPLSIPG